MAVKHDDVEPAHAVNEGQPEQEFLLAYESLQRAAKDADGEDATQDAAVRLLEKKGEVQNYKSWLRAVRDRHLRLRGRRAPADSQRVRLAMECLVAQGLLPEDDKIIEFDGETASPGFVSAALAGNPVPRNRPAPPCPAPYRYWRVWQAYYRVTETDPSAEPPTSTDVVAAVVRFLQQHPLTKKTVRACRRYLDRGGARGTAPADEAVGPAADLLDLTAIRSEDLDRLDKRSGKLVEGYVLRGVAPRDLADATRVPVGAIEARLQNAWATMRSGRREFWAFLPFPGAAAVLPLLDRQAPALGPAESLAVIACHMGFREREVRSVLAEGALGRGKLAQRKSDGLAKLEVGLGLSSDLIDGVRPRRAALFFSPPSPQPGAREVLMAAAGGSAEPQSRVAHLRQYWFQLESDNVQGGRTMTTPTTSRGGAGDSGCGSKDDPVLAAVDSHLRCADRDTVHLSSAAVRVAADPALLNQTGFRPQIDEHLNACPACRHEVEIVQKVRRPHEIRESARVALPRRWPFLVAGLALGAAAALLLPRLNLDLDSGGLVTKGRGTRGFSSVAYCRSQSSERILFDGDSCPSSAMLRLQLSLPPADDAAFSVMMCRTSPARCELLPRPYAGRAGSLFWPLEGPAGPRHVMVLWCRTALGEGHTKRMESNLDRMSASFEIGSALAGLPCERAISHALITTERVDAQ